MLMKFTPLMAAIVATSIGLAQPAAACTRAVYLGPEDRVLTGSSTDWKMPMVSDRRVVPRGMARDGAAGERSVTWTSRFGSLAVYGYDISKADGMSEAGLAVNMLWDVAAGIPRTTETRPKAAGGTRAADILDLAENPEAAIRSPPSTHGQRPCSHDTKKG